MRISAALLAVPFFVLAACGGGKPAASSGETAKEKAPTLEEQKKAFIDECTKGGDMSVATCTCSFDALVQMKGNATEDLTEDEKPEFKKKVLACAAPDIENIFVKACVKDDESMRAFCKCTYPHASGKVSKGEKLTPEEYVQLHIDCGDTYPDARANKDFVDMCTDKGGKPEVCACAFKELKTKTHHSNGVLSVYSVTIEKDIKAALTTCGKKKF